MSDTDDKDDNSSSPKEPKKKPWTRKEMEEAEPLPLPSVDDEEPKKSKKD